MSNAMFYNKCHKCPLVEVEYLEKGGVVMTCPVLLEQIFIFDCPDAHSEYNIMQPGQVSRRIVLSSLTTKKDNKPERYESNIEPI